MMTASTNAPSIASLSPGQNVFTTFGPGVISAVNRVDEIIYVVMAAGRKGLYLLSPKHITGENPFVDANES